MCRRLARAPCRFYGVANGTTPLLCCCAVISRTRLLSRAPQTSDSRLWCAVLSREAPPPPARHLSLEATHRSPVCAGALSLHARVGAAAPLYRSSHEHTRCDRIATDATCCASAPLCCTPACAGWRSSTWHLRCPPPKPRSCPRRRLPRLRRRRRAPWSSIRRSTRRARDGCCGRMKSPASAARRMLGEYTNTRRRR